MGFLYVVVPFDARIAAQLDAEAIAWPPVSPYGSKPTPRRVFAAAERLAGYDVEVQRSPERQWIDAHLERGGASEVARVHLKDCAWDDAPCDLSFERSSHWVIDALLRDLAEASGPLVLWADCDLATRFGPCSEETQC